MWIYGQDNRVKGTVGPWVFSKVFPFSAPKYEEGDTVGCGVDFVRRVIFFTKNGVLLGKRISHFAGHTPQYMHSRFAKTSRTGDAVEEPPHCRLFPAVMILGRMVRLRANFGTDPDKPFMYDPSQYGAETEPSTGLAEAPVAA
jgi:hypothetical protein